MYRKILVALENSYADENLLHHVAELARHDQAQLLLLHVADGWAARCFNQLQLIESEEMKEDRRYLESTAEKLRATGLQVTTLLALGNPPDEILKAVGVEQCDLIALGSHGHRYLADVLYGSTIADVRHKSVVPVLTIPAAKRK
jgi:nucleotide-binding universal stress UspA family protein